MTGPQGDRAQFGELLKRNILLYKLRHEYGLSVHATANYMRGEIANSIRSNPYQVNFLLGGVDETGPSLYYIDYLGSMAKTQFGVHGHASNFALSIMDRFYVPDMNLDEAKDLLRKCIHELNVRFMISLQDWKFKVVRKDSTEAITIAM